MFKTMVKGLAVAALSASMATSALAQASLLGDEKAELRAEQKRIFAQMFEEPDNLSLMFDYALVSIRLEDLEAAITTLERMLIYNKDLPRVHMELGAAYYRLGSYETSEYYFDNVLEFADVPADVRGKAEEFLRAIDQRTEKSVFTGSVSAGLAFASNATLGPSDPDVNVNGLILQLSPGDLENDDLAFKTTASVSHFYDLDQPDSDFWRTDLSIFNLHYFDETQSDVDSFLLRTGPQVSLDDQQFGPKIRPFVEFEHVRSGNDPLYTAGAAGVEYSDTLSDTLSVFGALRGAWRDYHTNTDADNDGDDDFDGLALRASGGIAYLPNEDIVLRGAVFLERNDADNDVNASIDATIRASATYTYDSGFEFADRLWSVSGFAQATYRKFDEVADQFAAQTSSGRRDIDLRAGVRHTFYLMDGFWVAADIDGLYRDSNIDLFNIENIGGGISVGLDF